jgi:two-component system, OmpR family, sensor histidine kinase TctE
VQPGATEAVLTITDSGPGISAEQRTRLFQPFSGSAGNGGSGLGLTICHGIVQALGGQISLDNLNPGLAAAVKLPLSTP